MKKIWPMLALGLGMYVLFALATLPASLLTDRLAPLGVNLLGVQGTVWQGSAQTAQVANVSLGTLSWNVRLLKLLTAQAGADVDVTRPDGSLNCGIFYGLLSGQISLDELKASFPIDALPPSLTQGGWNGRLQVNFSELVIDNGWPASAAGSLQALNLVGPLNNPNNFGSLKISFPASKPVAGALAGDIVSVDGPLRIKATLQLTAATRSYLISGTIGTDANTPATMTRTLQYLGPPDAEGNRPFSLEGAFAARVDGAAQVDVLPPRPSF
jgi:general secretion pathway protein N